MALAVLLHRLVVLLTCFPSCGGTLQRGLDLVRNPKGRTHLSQRLLLEDRQLLKVGTICLRSLSSSSSTCTPVACLFAAGPSATDTSFALSLQAIRPFEADIGRELHVFSTTVPLKSLELRKCNGKFRAMK